MTTTTAPELHRNGEPLTNEQITELMMRLGVSVRRHGVIHINPATHLITTPAEVADLGEMLIAVAVANGAQR